MKAMTRRSLLTNVTRGHHREAPGTTAPSTEVRGETGGERDDGATTARRRRDKRCRRRARKASGGPEDGDRRMVREAAPSGATAPAGARMQRVHSGAPCARTTKPSIGGAMLHGWTNGVVQSRNAALRRITSYDPRRGIAFVLCNGIAIVRVSYHQSLEGTEHDTLRSEERPEAPPPGHARASCTAHANPRV